MLKKNHQVDFICRRAGQSASWHVGERPAADLCTELNPRVFVSLAQHPRVYDTCTISQPASPAYRQVTWPVGRSVVAINHRYLVAFVIIVVCELAGLLYRRRTH